MNAALEVTEQHHPELRGCKGLRQELLEGKKEKSC